MDRGLLPVGIFKPTSCKNEVIDPSTYGLDGPVPQLQTNNNDEVPRSSVELTDEDRTILALSVDPLVDDGNHGIHLY